MTDYRKLTEAFCGVTINPDTNTSACPFAGQLHDHGSDRDVLWRWDAMSGKPHAHCFHAKCQQAWDALMRDLYHHLNEVTRQQAGGSNTRPHSGKAMLPAKPVDKSPRIVPCDHALAAYVASLNPLAEITEDMLLAASPVRIPEDPTTHGALLIDTLYQPGEHVLVFTSFRSQGQYLHTAGGATYRLSAQPGVQAVTSPRLPAGGPEGVWYLVQPVTGTWQPNPAQKTADGSVKKGRRHAACCTRFPYAVLESDELEPAVWLRILTQLEDPIAAIYTSGGKSVHALVKVDAPSAEVFNQHRDRLVRRLAVVGADPAAITAVRLSRLPGCLRHGTAGPDGKAVPYDQPRLQRLLYLNPNPAAAPLYKTLHPHG